MKKVLVTGSAGFIGFYLVKALLKNDFSVVGIDNINEYYDPALKTLRLKNIDDFIKEKNIKGRYDFFKLDISNEKKLNELFDTYDFDIVVNLAAQAGVRYSLKNPRAYVDSNLVGFTNLLECCRNSEIEHLIFASSSSVYGMNIKQPFSASDNTDYPISLYAATKKSNELLAYSYSHLFNLPTTGLRFFTVYGPYGRPDMAYYSFTKAIDEGQEINVFNNGIMERDFTYIKDIIQGLLLVIDNIPEPSIKKTTNSIAPFDIYNIGNNNPVKLGYFIELIESALSKKAKKNMLPMQDGDVPSTFADIGVIKEELGFSPTTTIEDGIRDFVSWYKDHK